MDLLFSTGEIENQLIKRHYLILLKRKRGIFLKRSRESEGVYKLLPWTIAITMSLILMLYINDQNSKKFEKFDSFYEGFLTS